MLMIEVVIVEGRVVKKCVIYKCHYFFFMWILWNLIVLQAFVASCCSPSSSYIGAFSYCNNIFPLFPSYVIFLFTTIFLVFLQQWFLFVKFCICFYNGTFDVLATTIFHFVSYIVCVFTMTFSMFYNNEFFLSILSCLCFSFYSFHNLHLGHDEHSKDLLMNPIFPSHHAIVEVFDFLLRIWEQNLKLYGRFLNIW